MAVAGGDADGSPHPPGPPGRIRPVARSWRAGVRAASRVRQTVPVQEVLAGRDPAEALAASASRIDADLDLNGDYRLR